LVFRDLAEISVARTRFADPSRRDAGMRELTGSELSDTGGGRAYGCVADGES
jgi:hypothetical protein